MLQTEEAEANHSNKRKAGPELEAGADYLPTFGYSLESLDEFRKERRHDERDAV